MKMQTHEAAKAPSTLTSAMPPKHSELLPEREQEERDRSLLPSEDWLRSPNPPNPSPVNTSSVNHSFGAMAISPTTSPMLQRKLAITGNGMVQRQKAVRQEEEVPEETPVGNELESENLKEHEGNEGGPGDDDRIKKKEVSVQLQTNHEGLQRKNLIQRMSSSTIQCARGYVRGAAKGAAKAIAESVSSWGRGGVRYFAPVPTDNDQEHDVGEHKTKYKFRNDGNGCIEFVAPALGYGPPAPHTCTVDIRPWFGAHGKAIKNSIKTTRYNHFLAANEARAAGLLDYPLPVPPTLIQYDNGYNNNPDGGSSPAGLTWHHHQSKGKMELIDRDVHAAFRHKGGYSIWGR